MSAYRHKSNTIKKFIIVSVVMLGLFGAGYYWYMGQQYPQDQDTSSDNIDYDGPSQEVINAGNEAKSKTVENDQESKSEQTAKDSSNDPTTTNNSAFTLDVSAAPTDTGLRVGSIISGLHSSGTCKLTLTKGSQVITKSSGVQPLTQYTSCEGFDVSLSSGTWSVTLRVTVDGTSVSKSTTVEVS